MDMSIVTSLIDKGPVGIIALLVLWQTWMIFKKEDTKLDKEKGSFSPVVDAFKTVVEMNSKIVSDQQVALSKISDEMRNDREYHRETIKVLFEKHDAHLAELKALPCRAAADEVRKKKDVA